MSSTTQPSAFPLRAGVPSAIGSPRILAAATGTGVLAGACTRFRR